MVFIVQAKPWKPEGIEKDIADTRKEALQAATEFLRRKFPVVTVLADDKVESVTGLTTIHFTESVLSSFKSSSMRARPATQHTLARFPDRRRRFSVRHLLC